jgi:hypothetical protein
MSNSSSQIVEAESSDFAPTALIREAIASKDVDPSKLQMLLNIREQWEAGEARKAYSMAISDFQRQAPIVAKADQGEKGSYAKIDRIWREIRPLLTGLGLSVTWLVCELKGEGENGYLHMEGSLRHKFGHSERLVFDLPLPGIIKTRDGRAVTNPAQMMGSAVSYAKRYATCAALGVVTGEDDDGEGAGREVIDKNESDEIADLIEACRGLDTFDEGAFNAWMVKTAGTSDPKKVPVNRLADVLAALNRKLGRMKA